MDLRSLPKVDVLSRSPALGGFPERVRVEAARRAIEEMRTAAKAGTLNGFQPDEVAVRKAKEMTETSLRPAINLSGVILHTGLGRARLAKAAIEQIARVASSHAAVELDLESGKRGDRQSHVRDLICSLTGAEDALVVNNAAAAVVLSLAALAKGREVVLSRGQMVEIGGSFRMPDIVRESGSQLVEVGCTNKTHLSDYENAISSETGAILRCHTSNYKIIGFVEQPSLEEVARLARARRVPCIDDMGTGCIIDTAAFGMVRVPTLQDSLAGGADVVTASGDKLLGGPQAGLIVGKSKYIAKIQKHPLARAFRVDKLTLAALEATLRLYREGRSQEVPTIAYLSRPLPKVKEMAEKLASAAKGAKTGEGITEIGGGSAPGTGVPTWRTSIPGKPNEVARILRMKNPPILGRIEKDKFWLDPRTIEEDELEIVCEVLRSL